MQRPTNTEPPPRSGPHARAASAASQPPPLPAARPSFTQAMKDHNATASSRGVQLLSPSLHRGLRATSSAPAMTSSSSATDSMPKKTALFDFDSFTLEAVRNRHESDSSQRPTYSSSNNGSFIHHNASGLSGLCGMSASSSGGSPRSPSMARSRQGTCEGPPASHPMDDFDWGHMPRSTHVHSFSSATQSQRSFQQFASMAGAPPPPLVNGKRMSMASASTTDHSSGLHAVPRFRTEIVARGWLQRRRGRVLKRWKPQYCVLKTDQRLCLYASEDTVNGKLESRFQVLRVTYNDRHGSFQVIGIGGDETPYKEEFKPLDDDGWRLWFLALREFFTPESIHEAMERMPELSLLPGVHASLLEDDEDDDDLDGDGRGHGDFAHEVEEMIMRPFGFRGDRSSASNTSSNSSNANQCPRVHSYAGVGMGDQEEPTPPQVHATISDRKTVLFNANEFPRYSTATTTIHTSNNNNNQTDATATMPARATHYRKLYSGGVRSKAASIASSTESSHRSTHHYTTPPSPSNQNEHFNQHHQQQQHPHAVDTRLPRDCPMIERDSHHALAMLERCGSESVVSTATSRESDGAFSWHRQ